MGLQIALRTGAVVRCARCEAHILRAVDDEATKRAFAEAEHARTHGFLRGSPEQVSQMMKSIIIGAAADCPDCSRR